MEYFIVTDLLLLLQRASFEFNLEALMFFKNLSQPKCFASTRVIEHNPNNRYSLTGRSSSDVLRSELSRDSFQVQCLILHLTKGE